MTAATSRAGFSLIEAIVAAVLGVLLVTLSLSTFSALQRAGQRQEEVRTRLSATRLTGRVLDLELSGARPAVDWVAHAPDSLTLRAFRRAAWVCAVRTDSALVVIPLPGRAIDIDRDSLLVMDGQGRWHAAGLVGVEADAPPCLDGAGDGALWRLDRSLEDAVLARVFEAGSYHFGPDLRYRIGGGGRQPLTGPGLEGYVFGYDGDRVRMASSVSGRPPLITGVR